MKGMKRTLLLLAVLGLSISVLSGSVLAQSLAEVADKEKKRRSETKGTAKVISERELQSGRRVTSLPADSAPAAGGEGDAASDDLVTGQEPEVDETTTREYWQSRANASREKIAALEEKLQSPESDWGGRHANGCQPDRTAESLTEAGDRKPTCSR